MAWFLSIFPTIAGWINLVIGWFQKRQKMQADQNSAVDGALKDHEQDGKQSVDDQQSSDEQNAAIDEQINQIDNPTPVVVVKPGGK